MTDVDLFGEPVMRRSAFFSFPCARRTVASQVFI